jgi:hypothetical protein
LSDRQLIFVGVGYVFLPKREAAISRSVKVTITRMSMILMIEALFIRPSISVAFPGLIVLHISSSILANFRTIHFNNIIKAHIHGAF